MRVNVYAEEMTDRVEIVEKVINGQTFTGVRFYLELPVTIPLIENGGVVVEGGKEQTKNVKGPFIHREGDDDSSAVTFWGKSDLRVVLFKALNMLDNYYECRKAFNEESRREKVCEEVKKEA